MEIHSNGKTYTADNDSTLLAFLKDKGFDPQKIVVSVNGEIAPPEKYQDIVLHDKDSLDLMSFVGGG